MISYENLHFYYYAVAFIFSLMFFSIVSFLIYIGAFSKVEVKSTKPPFKSDLHVAYKFSQNYTESRTFLTEAQAIAPFLDSFSIFHETFAQTRSQVGSSVGVVLPNKVEESLYTKLKKAGFKVQVFPAIEFAVVSAFPYRNQYSITIGVYRTYPLLKCYIKANRLCAHPIMELYTKDKIYFIAPLSKQFDFYAEEAVPVYECSSSEDEEESSFCLGGMHVHEKSFHNHTHCSKPVRTSFCDKCRRAV